MASNDELEFELLRNIAKAEGDGDPRARDAAIARKHKHDQLRLVQQPSNDASAAPTVTRRSRTRTAPRKPFESPAGIKGVRVDTDEHRVTTETVDALANHARVFVVGPALVELDDTSEIRPLARARVRDLATECTYFYEEKKTDAGEALEVDVHPPKWLSESVLARPSFPKVRALSGVVRQPILRIDGTVCEVPGYDAASQLFYAPTCAFPAMPAQPTVSDARAAYDALAELFADFPFDDPELGRAVSVASILSLVARHLVDHVPVDVASGSGPGCGKGLRVDVITTVGLGVCLARSPWPAEADEQRKLFDGFARRGARGILLDNVVAPIGGADFERNVTSTSVDVRLLGRSETSSFPWNASVLVTGNNVKFFGDMPRRCYLARIVPNDDRPDYRTDFRFPRLLEHVQEHRARFAVDALTVLAAHARAGRPAASREGAWGSFEKWTRVVADAVVFAGGRDPIGARVVRDAKTDTVREALEGLIHVWRAFGGTVGAPFACSEILTRSSANEEARIFLEELLDEQAPASAEKTKATRLSSLIARHADRWTSVDGELLGFVKGTDSRFGRRWMLSRPRGQA